MFAGFQTVNGQDIIKIKGVEYVSDTISNASQREIFVRYTPADTTEELSLKEIWDQSKRQARRDSIKYFRFKAKRKAQKDKKNKD